MRALNNTEGLGVPEERAPYACLHVLGAGVLRGKTRGGREIESTRRGGRKTEGQEADEHYWRPGPALQSANPRVH